MRGNGFIIFVICFSVGVFCRSFFVVGFPVALALLLVSASLVLYGIFGAPRFRAALLILPLALAAFIGGIARYELSEPRELILNDFIGERISAEGVISKEIDERETLVFLTVKLNEISVRDERFLTSEKIRVAVDRFEEYSYGDRIKISGVVSKPENFSTDAGRIFDYRSYLAKDGIYYEMFRPMIEVVSHGEGNPIVAALLKFKSAFLSSLQKSIPEPESALLGGLLLGEKHSLGEEHTENFRRSGLVHIIVLSGYNMTIVAYAIMRLFKRFPPVLSAGAGALGIIAFTIMAGASATAVRAAIMALLVILAGFVGRDYDIRRALAIAGFAMILHNPKILAFDPSFQLSFLATLGLIYLAPIFERWFRCVSARFGLREIIAATCATQIFVLPRLIDLSGTVSLIGAIANVLVLPLIPLTMLFGALAGFFGFIHGIIAAPFAFTAYAFLHYEVFMAGFFGNLPFAAVSTPEISAWLLAVAYGALVFFVWRLRHRIVDKSV